MEKQEYMAQLRALLTGRMAPAELERVTAYYEEYFDEAGPQGAQRVAEELGAPAELVQNIMGRNRGQGTPPPVREKRGIGGLWTAVLALCAAPIALPLLAAGLAVVACLAVAALCLVLGVCLAGGACVAVGVYVGVHSFTLLFSGGMSTLMFYSGVGMLTAGIGLLLIAGGVILAGLCCRGIAALIRRSIGGKEVQA